MTDDRQVLDLIETVKALQSEVADLRSTALVRAGRRPTGSIEPTPAATAPEGTLLMQGQTLQRADYAALWQWAVDHGAVVGGWFGPGNGTTTFVMPDLQGRVLVGVGTLSGDTYTLGQQVGTARHTLATTEMPAHGHTAASAGGHIHDSANGFMSSEGAHTGHFPGSQFLAAAGPDYGLAAWNSGGQSRGGHSHFMTFDILTGGAHAHTINNTGGGGAHENRQPSLAANWLIYT